MRKILFIMTMSLFFGCNIDDNCGEIIDKVIDDNDRFLLVIRFDDGGTNRK